MGSDRRLQFSTTNLRAFDFIPSRTPAYSYLEPINSRAAFQQCLEQLLSQGCSLKDAQQILRAELGPAAATILQCNWCHRQGHIVDDCHRLAKYLRTSYHGPYTGFFTQQQPQPFAQGPCGPSKPRSFHTTAMTYLPAASTQQPQHPAPVLNVTSPAGSLHSTLTDPFPAASTPQPPSAAAHQTGGLHMPLINSRGAIHVDSSYATSKIPSPETGKPLPSCPTPMPPPPIDRLPVPLLQTPSWADVGMPQLASVGSTSIDAANIRDARSIQEMIEALLKLKPRPLYMDRYGPNQRRTRLGVWVDLKPPSNA